jgi:hypothetical protein
VYIPATVADLRSAVRSGLVSAPRRHAFAASAALARQYPGADQEELEYVAMQDAARASLRLLSMTGSADSSGEAGEVGETGAAIRVVIAADAEAVAVNPDGDASSVFLDAPIAWRDVAAVHLDGADAADAVRAAMAVIDQADLGDPDAEFLVGGAEDFELAWYAPDEIAYLIEELDAGAGG